MVLGEVDSGDEDDNLILGLGVMERDCKDGVDESWEQMRTILCLRTEINLS